MKISSFLQKISLLLFFFHILEVLIHVLQLIDRSVECTSSVLQALIMFKELYPGYRKEEIGKCVKNASKFIEDKQRKDGSWYLKLSFGVNYLTF
uniref:Squalene cyclase C-terminal domain-containing protein n=1 Tax=Aegilops tauschii subsp. strangulata TaxID=200361 RepID=A0A453RGX0_AEGTS